MLPFFFSRVQFNTFTKAQEIRQIGLLWLTHQQQQKVILYRTLHPKVFFREVLKLILKLIVICVGQETHK